MEFIIYLTCKENINISLKVFFNNAKTFFCNNHMFDWFVN